MTSEKVVKCSYCGKVFREDDDADKDPKTREGIHRSEEHVTDDEVTRGPKNGDSIVNKWKKSGEGGKAL